MTGALLPDSPPIDAGTPDGDESTCETSDQRGLPRPQRERCDIGAFEVEGGGPPPSRTPFPTPTPTVPAITDCAGDCNSDGEVLVNELVMGVNIALERAPLTACTSFDLDRDRAVRVAELVAAVNNSMNGCS